MTTIISRQVTLPAIPNLNKPERETVLHVRNAARISHQNIRYEYQWDGYKLWCGAIMPAYMFTSDRGKQDYVSAEQYEQVGKCLAAS
jgi:hypothetical protein